jgi:ribokinase
LPDDLLNAVSIITPNKKEAEMLTGCNITDINTAKEAAKILAGKGIKIVIITLGAEGALILMDGNFTVVPALSVSAVDTTAAGDIFNGALAVAISEQQNIIEAVQFANHAAAISVTKLGAQASAPYRNEVNTLMNSVT